MNPILDFLNITPYESEIRFINLVLHVLSGSVAVLSGFINIFHRKNLQTHLLLGKIFYWSVIFLLLTSIISNLITLVFPFYILVYISYYLNWFSAIEVQNEGNLLFSKKMTYLWGVLLNIKAFVLSLFMIFLGTASITTNNIDLTCYILLGPLLLYYSINDFNSLRDRKLNKYLFSNHKYKILFSYMVVVLGFTVSQFSWLDGYYRLFLWIAPFTLTLLFLLYASYIRKVFV